MGFAEKFVVRIDGVGNTIGVKEKSLPRREGDAKFRIFRLIDKVLSYCFLQKIVFCLRIGMSCLFTPLKFRQSYSSLHGTVKGRLLIVATVLRMRSVSRIVRFPLGKAGN